jgi:hypothetical protein
VAPSAAESYVRSRSPAFYNQGDLHRPTIKEARSRVTKKEQGYNKLRVGWRYIGRPKIQMTRADPLDTTRQAVFDE